MTLAAKAMSFVAANLTLVTVIAFILVCIYLVVKFVSGSSNSGPNPFSNDTTRTPEPLVTDLSKRDKVLKQGKSPGGVYNMYVQKWV